MKLKDIKKIVFVVCVISLVSFLSLNLFIVYYAPKHLLHVNQDNLLVVFGAGYQANGEPTKALRLRLDKGIEIWRYRPTNKFFVSGCADEVKVMSHYLEEHGIPVDRIIQDVNGENTRQTILNVKQFIKNDNMNVILISQAYHLPRVEVYSRFYQLPNFSTMVTDRVPIDKPDMWKIAVRESFAILLFPFITIFENRLIKN